jgi:general secretion pathway protein F
MPNFRYRALTQSGEMVTGQIAAPTAAEVIRRIEYLRLVPIDTTIENASRTFHFNLSFQQTARAEDVTTFTHDLALLLKAGARLEEALELLSEDNDVGGLRLSVARIRSGVLSGESFADALSQHPNLFPPIYVALVRVGESSGMLAHILEALARERGRAESLRRKLGDALRYPAFVLFGATCVLVFFLMFVLPKFASVLRDFGATVDPVATFFFRLSDLMVAHQDILGVAAAVLLAGSMLLLRHPRSRARIITSTRRLPFMRTVATFYQTAMFCRNLDILLVAAVPLTTTLRILADMMQTMGDRAVWSRVVERVRHGGKLSEAVSETGLLPAMAVRMLRLGEETGELPVLAGRVAEFYETKLQRSLDRLVGLVGPVAIVAISIVVGGLIISVMTSLLSVNELVR